MRLVSEIRRRVLDRKLLVLVLVGLIVPQSEALSQDSTAKGRDVFHCSEEHLVEIPDLDAQFLTLFVCSGLRFIDGGEVASFQVYGGGDYANGAGPEIGYQVVEFEDGSKIVLRFKGTRMRGGEATGEFSGTFESISGVGRFADSQLEGEYQGRSIGNDGFLDWTMKPKSD